jgi:hypothetical protein
MRKVSVWSAASGEWTTLPVDWLALVPVVGLIKE